MSTKIGFNNFKAFGSDMQTFSKKPITLVYGPNSIGKSSLLHSQLYLDYYKIRGKRSNLFKSDFAGDTLDLGGIDNFTHKHNIENTINYNFKHTSKEDVFKILFNYKDVVKIFQNDCELIESLKSDDIKFDLVEIEKKLNSCYQNTGVKFKYFVEMHNSSYDHRSSKSTFNEKIDELVKKILIDINSSDLDSIDDLKTVLESTFFKLNEANNFEKSILATKELAAENIYETLLLLKYIMHISEIEYTIKLFSKGDKINSIVDLFIDHEKVFSFDAIKNLWKINNDQELIRLTNNLKRKTNKNSLDYYFYFSLDGIVENILKRNEIQYYGPLRHYPERWEMYHIEKEISAPVNEKTIFTKTEKSFLKVNWFLEKTMAKFESKNLLSKLFFVFLSYVNMLVMLLGTMVSKSYRNMLTRGDKQKDIWNEILPKSFRLIRQNRFHSKEIWKKLVQSPKLVGKLNLWLGNKDKLKSTYEIKIEKQRVFRNLLVLIEKILNIRPIYQYQIKFIDKANKIEVTPKDMGLGISQMLPVLVSALGSKNAKIYLEQPELHLHPVAQMELMDEFIKSYHKNQNEFIMESHSEHLLLRVMKRMRQTAQGILEDESLRLTPEDVCLLYVDNDGEKTYISELRLSKNGKLLDHWPNGFFEEGYKERFL